MVASQSAASAKSARTASMICARLSVFNIEGVPPPMNRVEISRSAKAALFACISSMSCPAYRSLSDSSAAKDRKSQ